MCARRQTDDEDLGLGVTKAGHGFAPIGLVFVRAAFFTGHLFTPGHQAWAKAATDDLLVQGFEFHVLILTDGDLFFRKIALNLVEIRLDCMGSADIIESGYKERFA